MSKNVSYTNRKGQTFYLTNDKERMDAAATSS